MSVETLERQMAGGDELIEPPALPEVDWAEVKEIVDLSKADDTCQGIDKSCKPIVHMGGLVCPRLKMWDARRWLSKPTRGTVVGRRKEVRFWRGVADEKNKQIRQLREEINSLKDRLDEETHRHENQIKELLEEREIYSLEIIRLMWEKEGLRSELEKLKEERDKLAIQVTRYFEENGESKSGKKVKGEKEEVIKRRPGAKEGHKGWYRLRSEVVDEVVDETLSQCPHCGSLELTECEKVTERTVEDIVPVKVKVTRHRQHYYWCRGCKRTVSKKTESIKNGRLGENILSLTAEFKHELNLPYGKIVRLFEALCGLKVTVFMGIL